MCSVTIPPQAPKPLVHHQASMNEFKIDYQVRRDDEGHEYVHRVHLPSTARKLPVHHKTPINEFKIDYHVRRDNEGQEYVHRVYLPSTYKGWAIMVERNDTASPRMAPLQPDSSVGVHLNQYLFPQVLIRQCSAFRDGAGKVVGKP